MHRLLPAVTALVCALAAPVLAAPTASQTDRPDVRLPIEGTIITNPDWVRIPSGDEFAHYYPPVAQMLGLDGRAVTHCEVTTLGTLDRCTILREAPVGMGFGDAALAMTNFFRMRPQLRDGVAVNGGEINIPIRFQSPVDQVAAMTPDTATPAPSAKALALASRIAALSFGPDQMQAYMRQTRDWIAKNLTNVSLTEQEQAALDDYIDAIGASGPERAASTAETYARRLSEQQLADADAFLESPSGRAWLSLMGEADANTETVQAQQLRLNAAMQEDARRRFCAKYDCFNPNPGTAPPAPAK